MLPTEHRGSGKDALFLFADSCGVQDKNRYMLFFLSFFVTIGKEKRINLCFMNPGRTKNVCDGRFILVKRLLRWSDAIVSCHMIDLIEQISINVTCVPIANVNWRDWKSFLTMLFNISAYFLLSQYYIFIFFLLQWIRRSEKPLFRCYIAKVPLS